MLSSSPHRQVKTLFVISSGQKSRKKLLVAFFPSPFHPIRTLAEAISRDDSRQSSSSPRIIFS